MPGRVIPPYHCSSLAALVPTWLALDPPRRDALLRRAEALHDTLEPGTAYPFAFIAFRLTGFRRDYGDDSLLVGQALLPDLRQLIDQLSHSLELPPADGEVLTAQQLAQQLNISTKTLTRWRKDGLRWRWVTLPTIADTGKTESDNPGKKLIGFTAAALAHYRERRPDRIARASSFTQLTPAQRRRLLQRARRLAAATDASFNRVADHLARRSGRALETVRLILEKHDRDHPEDPLFADRTGPLTGRQKRLIGRAYRMGIHVGKLAERFRRSRATIYRVILDRRAARALRLRLDHHPHPQFALPDAAAVYLRDNLSPDLAAQRAPRSTVPTDGLPETLRPLYVQPVVSPDKIRALFLRYNFLKFRAATTRQAFAHAPARARDLDAFEQDVARAARVRSLLVTWHLPIVLSVARRHLVGKPDNSPHRLVQLLETGHPLLIDLVDAYDPAGRPTFESLLTTRLLQTFAADPASQRGKALRRATAAEVMQRLINLADESGIHLAITDAPPPEDDADGVG